MNDAKYIGMDVHPATISVEVRDSRGNLVMEAILETAVRVVVSEQAQSGLSWGNRNSHSAGTSP
jgi:hypothetical protein